MDIIITNEVDEKFLNEQQFNTQDEDFFANLHGFSQEAGIKAEERIGLKILKNAEKAGTGWNQFDIHLSLKSTVLFLDPCGMSGEDYSVTISFEYDIKASDRGLYWGKTEKIRYIFPTRMMKIYKKIFQIKNFGKGGRP